jgi:hypothetical protein
VLAGEREALIPTHEASEGEGSNVQVSTCDKKNKEISFRNARNCKEWNAFCKERNILCIICHNLPNLRHELLRNLKLSW